MKRLLTIFTLSSILLEALAEVPNINLNDGHKTPIIGIGTCCGIAKSVVYNMVKDAIQAGYRHIDTAYIYDNELEVGQAINEEIKAGKVNREDIFVTTKVWNTFHSKAKAYEAVKLALKKLNLKYIDLMLIHWPMGYAEGGADNPKNSNNEIIASNIDYIETWQALEQCVQEGLVKSIGLSNFNHEQIDRLLMLAKIKPTVNQIESHPHLTQKPLIEYCKKHSIAVTAYSPLGGGKLVEDHTITNVGTKHNKTAAQVMIRYQIQRGVSVIPRSTQKQRIQEDFDVFNFNLTAEEISTIESLNIDLRYNTEEVAKNHKYYPFRIPY